MLSLKTGIARPQFHIKFDTKFQTVEQEELSSQWKPRASFIAPIVGRPISATPTSMQRSEGRNTQNERMRNKLKHYESSHKDIEPGIQNWGKTQGDRKQKSGQGVSDPERQE